MNASDTPIALRQPPATDEDPQETGEWVDALEGVVRVAGPERGRFLLHQLQQQAQQLGIERAARAAAHANQAPNSEAS